MNLIKPLIALVIILILSPGFCSAGIGDRFSKVDLLSNVIECPEITSTSTPASNKGRVYVKDSGGYSSLYFKSDSGTEFQLTPVSTQIYHTQVRITNAQLKALRATPKVLIAAPGTGKFIQLVSAVLLLDYGSNVLTESADNLVIEYTTSGIDATASIESTGLIDAAADTMAFIQPATIANAAAADVANKSLQLFNTGDGEFAGNAGADTQLLVRISYRVHETGL